MALTEEDKQWIAITIESALDGVYARIEAMATKEDLRDMETTLLAAFHDSQTRRSLTENE